MLKLYLTSILVWWIVIASSIFLTNEKIQENGWYKGAKKKLFFVRLAGQFSMSAIPVFRVFVVLSIFIMFSVSKDDFDKKYKRS